MKHVYVSLNGASIKIHRIAKITIKKIYLYKFDEAVRDQKPETSQWNVMSYWEKKQILKNGAQLSFFKETKYDCVSIDRFKFEVTGSAYCKALGQMVFESKEKAQAYCRAKRAPREENDPLFSSFWDTNKKFSDDERAMAQEIINLGYRHLSKKHHPDLAGDQTSMQKLNKIKEKLWDLV